VSAAQLYGIDLKQMDRIVKNIVSLL